MIDERYCNCGNTLYAAARICTYCDGTDPDLASYRDQLVRDMEG